MTDFPPIYIFTELEPYFGKIHTSNLLLGMGYGRAFLCESDHTRFVLKLSKKETEKSFYEQIAPLVAKIGISVPKLYASGKANNQNWIAIEYIPTPLPENRWTFDEEVLFKLSQLHKLNESFPKFSAAVHEWTQAMNDLALNFFPTNLQTKLSRDY